MLIICSRQYLSHAICSVLCTPVGDVKVPFLEYFLVYPSQICQVRVLGCRVVGSASEFSQDKIAVRTGPTGQVIGLVVLSLQSMSTF